MGFSIVSELLLRRHYAVGTAEVLLSGASSDGAAGICEECEVLSLTVILAAHSAAFVGHCI